MCKTGGSSEVAVNKHSLLDSAYLCYFCMPYLAASLTWVRVPCHAKQWPTPPSHMLRHKYYLLAAAMTLITLLILLLYIAYLCIILYITFDYHFATTTFLAHVMRLFHWMFYGLLYC